MTGARAYWQLVGLPSVKLTLKYMTMTVFPGGKLVLLRHSHPTSKQHTVLPVLQRCDRPTHTHTHSSVDGFSKLSSCSLYRQSVEANEEQSLRCTAGCDHSVVTGFSKNRQYMRSLQSFTHPSVGWSPFWVVPELLQRVLHHFTGASGDKPTGGLHNRNGTAQSC